MYGNERLTRSSSVRRFFGGDENAATLRGD